ncbi:M1 family aminopeptidase [Pseudoalteromonas xiamenensis]
MHNDKRKHFLMSNLPRLVAFLALCMVSLASAADYRINPNQILQKQDVYLQLDPREESYSGVTTLYLSFAQDASEVAFHSKALQIDSVTLVQNEQSTSLALSQADEFDVVRQTLVSPISGSVKLIVHFKGLFSNAVEGLFVQRTEGKKPFIFSQFQKMLARRAFPTVDDPSFKTHFTFTLDIPKQYQALHNTVAVKEEIKGEHKVVHFKATAKLNTDVLALAVGEFKSTAFNETQLKSKVFNPVDSDVSVPAYFSDVLNHAVSGIEGYLKSPFPFDKLDFFVAPIETLAGMENVGLVALNPNQFPDDDDGQSQCEFTKLVAHEVAHMWFGNSVTMAWYDDFWLNETFAEFMAVKIVRRHFPELASCTYGRKSRLYHFDTNSVAPMRAKMQKLGDNIPMDDFHYVKGVAVLNMVEQVIGEDALSGVMQAYFAENKYGNANTNSFLSKLSAFPLAQQLVDSFTSQSSYPLITLKKNNGEFSLEQSDFNGNSDKRWTVPVFMKIWNGHSMLSKQGIVSGKTLAIKNIPSDSRIWLNEDDKGYYRFFDASGQDGLLLTKLNEREREVYFDNLDALAEHGYIDFQMYLEQQITTINTMPKGSRAVSIAFSALSDAFVSTIPAEKQAVFSAYLKTKLPRIEDWSEVAALSTAQSWLSFYGLYLHDDRVYQYALRQYAESDFLHSDNLEALVKVLAFNANKAQYRALLGLFEKAEAEYKDVLLDSLGYVSNTEHVSLFYDLLLSDATLGFAIGYRFQYPAFQPRFRAHVAQFFATNQARVASRLAQDELQWMPYNFMTACSEKERDLVIEAFSQWQKIPGLAAKEQEIVERILACSGNAQKALNSMQTILSR